MFDILAINWHVNPEIFSIGALSIRWYSLLFISGFILGWFIFRGFFRREGVPETLLDPLLYTLLIGTIVGARLGHCLFYQPDYYLGSWQGFAEIFMPWKGGLASHGGTIALFIAMIWFARHFSDGSYPEAPPGDPAYLPYTVHLPTHREYIRRQGYMPS